MVTLRWYFNDYAFDLIISFLDCTHNKKPRIAWMLCYWNWSFQPQLMTMLYLLDKTAVIILRTRSYSHVKSTICSTWSSLGFLVLDLSNLWAFSAAFSPSDLKYCSNRSMWLLIATIFQDEIIIAYLYCSDIALVWYIPTYSCIKHSYC